MHILGIDTSCDDTAAAVVSDGRYIRANLIRSQLLMHAKHGGVVPEVASRAHLSDIAAVVHEALEEAGMGLEAIDAVGVTYGPGLSGALLVGLNFAKGLALARDLPLLPINHLEGHIYSNWLIPSSTDLIVHRGAEEDTDLLASDGEERVLKEPTFPLIVLIVSGGHTELLLMREHCRYLRLGSTRDDAAGEAFDKVGRQLGLGFPGGPAIERAAVGYTGNAVADLPRAWLRGSYDFSFSGLKTAVWQRLEALSRGQESPVNDETRAALAVAFQESVIEVLATKVAQAAAQYSAASVAICGGVASNSALRERITSSLSIPVHVPPPVLCVDNGAMIAAAAFYRWQHPELAGEYEDPLLVDAVAGLGLPTAAT